ncbi:MAG: sulfite reductase subunit alpha [Hyphomicrobium sp.]|nr:sulfite reductase subunit alpha [Hyphomicrobium sp.]PPC82307.1 MAG: sulfite reductase subunit alpha [Hyphomicrobium sp.]
MTVRHLLPKSAPFTTDDIELLNGLVDRSSPTQRTWLAGFFAGLEAGQVQAQGAPAQPAAAQRPKVPLLILYASESGNAEGLALKARKAADKQGFQSRVVDMAEADLAALPKAKNILVIASTWGEGDPPQRAADFYGALMGDAAPRIDGVRFAVLALGDTAYVNFCLTGRKLDERLEALGGMRAAARADLDLDFAKQAAEWTDRTLKVLAPVEDDVTANIVHVDFKSYPEIDNEPRYTAENPIEAEITALVDLNGSGSTRETWHVEFAPDATDFEYTVGDAIGVLAENDPVLVEDLLVAVGLGGDSALAAKLVTSYDVTTLSRPLVDAYAKLTGRYDVSMLAVAESFAAFSADRQLIDLFLAYPEKLEAEQLLALLRPLPPRLYSVASSHKAHNGEAHLLVGAVRWAAHGRARKGVASTFLADRRKRGDKVRIYVKPNRHFRLPVDGDRPIVMIGAGTGVAPYRGFIAERGELGSKGKSWLFFGERNYTNDFLYQLEWQDHVASGALSRIDVAFSRDQPEKIYVQNRLWERRAELQDWIGQGAHLYVCGDEKGMARDVNETLVRILAEPHLGDLDAGRARLKELTKDGRYQRDVY